MQTAMFPVQLMVQDGNGEYLPASADQIIEAARRAIDTKLKRGVHFREPSVAERFLTAKLGGLNSEVFAVVFLDAKYRMIEYAEMFQGTINSAAVYPREIVRKVIATNAAAVILSHNHPSGSPDPSAADLRITKHIKEVLALLDVNVIDHVIVGGNTTHSMALHGEL